MPSDSQKIRAFMEERWIPDEAALAAWIIQVGETEAAKDSGLPKSRLQAISKAHYPSGPDLVCSPEHFGLGCLTDDLDTEATPEASLDDENNTLSIESLSIADDANLPREHRINVPLIDESTDQGRIGSCVSWAGAHVMDNALANADKTTGQRANPTCIYGFIKGHGLDPWPTTHGSTLGALATALSRYGAPKWESMRVYRSAPEGNPANLPHPPSAILEAKANRIQSPHWIESWTDNSIYQAMCLMHGDQKARPGRQLVVCTAFDIPASFFNAYTAKTGIVMMPPSGDRIKGGHAVVFIGWKHINDRLYLIVKNSWGTGFGDGGYLYVPVAFVKKYFRRSFVIPALLREPPVKSPEEKKSKRAPLAETLAVGSSVLAAFLIVGLVTLLVGTIPSLLASADRETAEPRLTETVTPPPEDATNSSQAEQMSQPVEQNVLEIYSRTLRLIDQSDD